MTWLAGIAGVLLWLATCSSLLRTLVVPRGSSGLTMYKNRGVRWCFTSVARRLPSYRARDRVLLWQAPLSILTSLVMWLLMFYVSYGLLMFATSELGVRASFREAGSSLFTLGFASEDRATLTALDFIAAATGPIAIGLLIGYLPTMYAAYQRREAEVTLILSRAGEPNWGPELLARHANVGITSKLDLLWPAWEAWAADVGESHTNFPILIYMRSARPNRNWLISLLCVMDAAAIHMSLNPGTAPVRTGTSTRLLYPGHQQASMRLLLRQGITCLRELADVVRIPYDPDPSPDRPSAVTFEEFLSACQMLTAAGYQAERTPEQAYPHFRGWRANYESLAYSLASNIDAVRAPWSGDRVRSEAIVSPTRPVNRTPSEAAD
ncbi:MAG: hypothetical protein WCP28_18705 [Actinomycetes bacterium]